MLIRRSSTIALHAPATADSASGVADGGVRGCPRSVHRDAARGDRGLDSLGADVIIDLEDWNWAWVPSVPVGKVFMSFPMEDEDDVDPKVRDVAAFIASLVGSGRKVLVHCTEGLNRSGVVIARALMEMGRSAPEAIELVRRGRGPSVDGFPALGNQAFTAWLDAEDR
jgi:protein-tyrosine phosphatase